MSEECKYCTLITENVIGETVVYCDIWAEWKNVTLGDCFGNCESQEVECES